MSIEAMRQALEALDGLSEPYDVLKAQNALRAAIEQSEKQEPVAWRYDLKQGGSFAGVSTEYSRVKLSIGKNWQPLYTAPRQWQGLTDEERGQVINANFGTGLWQMAKDIEAKLKEKNT